MNALLGGALGAVIMLGVLVIALGLMGATPSIAIRRGPFLAGPLASVDRLMLRMASAVFALVATWMFTGWLVGSLMMALLASAAPSFHGARARRQAAITKVEAVASWAEMLRDTMAASAGIQEAIVATAKVAPVAVRPQVRQLAGRLEREPFAAALYGFAVDAKHPMTDMIVASLVLAGTRQSGHLTEVLGEIARSSRQTAAMRLKVEAARASTWSSTRWVAGITIVFCLGMVLFNRAYLQPFDSAVGQLMLLLIGLVFLVAGLLMQRMAVVDDPPRLLLAEGAPGTARVVADLAPGFTPGLG